MEPLDGETTLNSSDGKPIGREQGALLHRFRKNYGVTLQEFGERAGLSQPMLTRFERGSCGRSVETLEAWRRVLRAMDKIWKEKSAERKAEFDKLNAGWMESFLPNSENHFSILPNCAAMSEIEVRQKQIVEIDKSSLELSRAIDAQWMEFQAEVEAELEGFEEKEPGQCIN